MRTAALNRHVFVTAPHWPRKLRPEGDFQSRPATVCRCAQAQELDRQQRVEEAAQSAAKRRSTAAPAEETAAAQGDSDAAQDGNAQPAAADQLEHATTSAVAAAAAAAPETTATIPAGEDRLPDDVVAELLRRQR